MAPADLRGAVDVGEPLDVVVLHHPVDGERLDERLLVDVVRRQRAADGEDRGSGVSGGGHRVTRGIPGRTLVQGPGRGPAHSLLTAGRRAG